MSEHRKSMDAIVSLAKRRGFVYPGSEIYGGLANTWDYGPLGVELKNNIKWLWWKAFVRKRKDVVGLESSILMNPQTWQASGHLGGFSDPLMDCKTCKTRHRADKLLEEHDSQSGRKSEGLNKEALKKEIEDQKIACPSCGDVNFTDIRDFNLMFKTFQGVTEETSSTIYLRPETAQGIFVNFKNAQTTSRKQVPFGIAQIGKSFRNEISPGNFIFRTREFEQMELEYFCEPEAASSTFAFWKEYCRLWLQDEINLSKSLIRVRDHGSKELSHYSQATSDIEFLFPFGWGELWGVAHRGDFDLRQHQQQSGKDLTYHDTSKNMSYLPHVIEPSLGVERLVLAVLISAYEEEKVDADSRVVLRLSKNLAPFQVAVLPLSKKLSAKAEEVLDMLIDGNHAVDFDEKGSIGKRYVCGR